MGAVHHAHPNLRTPHITHNLQCLCILFFCGARPSTVLCHIDLTHARLLHQELNTIDIKISKRQAGASRLALTRLREVKACIRSLSQLLAEIIKPTPDAERCRSYYDKTLRDDAPIAPISLYVKAQIHRHQGLLSLKAIHPCSSWLNPFATYRVLMMSQAPDNPSEFGCCISVSSQH